MESLYILDLDLDLDLEVPLHPRLQVPLAHYRADGIGTLNSGRNPNTNLNPNWMP